MSRQKYTRVHTIPDGESIVLNGVQITPFRLAEDYVYAFILEEAETRVLIAPDELFGWQPPEFTHGVDLAILPMGIVEHDPITGERIMDASHPILKMEATFAQTLEMVQQIGAKRTILTHIEEMDRYSHDDLLQIQDALGHRGHVFEFAYDTMTVDVG